MTNDIAGFDLDWLNAEKKEDPNYDGSLAKKLGFDSTLCPTCRAHLKEGICLNTCHLSDRLKKRFAEILTKMSQRLEEAGPD